MARTGPRRWVWRAWRAVCHPLTLPLWVALGAWSLATLVDQRTYGGFTLTNIGRLVDQLTGRESFVSQSTMWTYDLYAVSEPDGGAASAEAGGKWRIIDTNLHSADELSRLWQDEPDRVVQVTVTLEEERTGAAAHTRRRWQDSVAATPFSSSRTLTSDEGAAFRRAAVDHLLRDYPQIVDDEQQAGRVAHLRAGDVNRASRIWTGYGVNAGFVVGGVMSVLTLARTVGAAPRVIRRARERRRARRGLCTQCAYPLADVTGGVCPECGTGIQPAVPLGEPPG